jgi:hypothetical protein
VRTLRIATLGLVISAGLLAGGCTQHLAVKGKVIGGQVAFVGAVDSKDERLSGPGLEGATVVARGTGTRSETTLATATSNPKGEFTLDVRDERSLLGTIEFRGRKAGHIDARATMPAPTSDRRLLVILPQGPTGAPGGR